MPQGSAVTHSVRAIRLMTNAQTWTLVSTVVALSSALVTVIITFMKVGLGQSIFDFD